MPEQFHFTADGERLTATAYHAAGKPLGVTLLLGHGSATSQHDPFMLDYATGLAERGVLVVTYDSPFLEYHRSTPDGGERLETVYREAISAARQCRPKNRLFIGGKSLGGHVASKVVAAADDDTADVYGLVVLGYPLHPIGERGHHAHHLYELDVPMLVVQGSRDVFGAPEELRAIVEQLPEGSELYVVEGGDHSLSASSDEARRRQVHGAAQDEIARWLAIVAERPLRSRPKRAAVRQHVGDQIGSLRRSK
jgi:predicted alpha/beta-hydrolase family hydrolase